MLRRKLLRKQLKKKGLSNLGRRGLRLVSLKMKLLNK